MIPNSLSVRIDSEQEILAVLVLELGATGWSWDNQLIRRWGILVGWRAQRRLVGYQETREVISHTDDGKPIFHPQIKSAWFLWEWPADGSENNGAR